VFKHPSTFNTLAMDPTKKWEIMDDLDAFRNRKDYYLRICKAWKLVATSSTARRAQASPP
jgi:chaperone BCS1